MAMRRWGTVETERYGAGSGDPLASLSEWCRRCWDPESGDLTGKVTIESVDGPGWWITVDLRDTALEGRTLDSTVIDLGSARWCQYWVDGTTFSAATSTSDVALAIDLFRMFAGAPAHDR